MWAGRAAGTAPEVLQASLEMQLSALDTLVDRLAEKEGCTRAAEVSMRELVQRRSRTALSCRIEARLRREAMAADADPEPVGPCELFFEKPELLEHTLSFCELPRHLSGAGQVCTAWYLASRMQTLWELQLRRSGRLTVAGGAAELPVPHEARAHASPRSRADHRHHAHTTGREGIACAWRRTRDVRRAPRAPQDDCTLFETVARIERHGPREGWESFDQWPMPREPGADDGESVSATTDHDRTQCGKKRMSSSNAANEGTPCMRKRARTSSKRAGRA